MSGKKNRIPNAVAKGRRKSAYDRLLSSERLRGTTDRTREPDLETFSDKGRIVRSAPFRRLQSKAQVFSMARTGAVRTRLTHSLEVANYGELIAEKLARQLVDRGSLEAKLQFPFVQTVENACLLHDIGNPPFGHMGEYAIREWFKQNNPELINHCVSMDKITREEATRHLEAYSSFDGNPHGFRIITRLQWLNDEFGMNLTCSLLGSYLKYLGTRAEKDKKFLKKIGFFPSEEQFVKLVWQRLELRTEENGLPAQRHPLTFVMEAADDIAYCLSDIEDAIEKHVVSERKFLEWTRSKRVNLEGWVPGIKKKAFLMENGVFHFFRLSLSRDLVNRAVNAYLQHEDEILDGSIEKSLFGTDPEATRCLDLLKEFSSINVYTSREAIETELVGLNAITGLLNQYKAILLLPTSEFDKISSSRNKERLSDYPILSLLFTLLPKKHLLAYGWNRRKLPALEPIFRTQLVVDYVAGMTDSHVLKIFNMMNGTQQFGLE